MGTSTKDHEYKYLEGSKKISENEALKISKDILKVKDPSKINLSETGKGADVPVYTATYVNGDQRGFVDITKQGGNPITLLKNRPVDKKKISLNEGMENATKYMKQLGFEDMVLFQSSQYDNIGSFTYLYSQDGVRVYSDTIEVKVALDNGEILGLTSQNYMKNHRERKIPKPKISNTEAKEMVNPNVNIQEEFLAIIDNDLGEEVLAYEFLGVNGDDTYRIFINALDGKEEKVEKLGGSEMNYAIN